jgi:hypothetical protein
MGQRYKKKSFFTKKTAAILLATAYKMYFLRFTREKVVYFEE